MSRTFKSRVAKWFVGICIAMTIVFLISLYLCFNSTWIIVLDVILMGIGVYTVFDMLLHTDYTINGDKLHIRCGYLFRMDLPISKITEITHKSTLLSSPALSAKRIGLKYGKRALVYVSPKNQDDFIAALRAINPGIIIQDD